MYGDPAGSRSDARASSLICAGAAVSGLATAAAAAGWATAAVSAPLASGVSIRSLEQRPLPAARDAGAGAGLARPMAAGDSVSDAPVAGNPKAKANIRPQCDGGALDGAVLARDDKARNS